MGRTLGDLGRAEAGLDQDIAALGAEGARDGVREGVDTGEELGTRLNAKLELLAGGGEHQAAAHTDISRGLTL